MIIDTDVLIWYMRGNPRAKEVVEKRTPFLMSAVTYMELVQGMKNKTEFRRFQKQIRTWRTVIVQIDQDISARAIFYVQEYFLSHSMQMADSLIAATAVAVGNTLLTANDKHYEHVPNLELKTFVP